VILFGLVMFVVTAEIALLIAPSIAAAPGRLVIELSKVGMIVRVACAGPPSTSEAAPASSSDVRPPPVRPMEVLIGGQISGIRLSPRIATGD